VNRDIEAQQEEVKNWVWSNTDSICATERAVVVAKIEAKARKQELGTPPMTALLKFLDADKNTKVTSSDASFLLRSRDRNGDGSVSKYEWRYALKLFCKLQYEHALRDNNRWLKAEAGASAQSLLEANGGTLDQSALNNMYYAMDVDRDGTVSRDDLDKWSWAN